MEIVRGINISLKFNVKVLVENCAFTLLFYYLVGTDIIDSEELFINYEKEKLEFESS